MTSVFSFLSDADEVIETNDSTSASAGVSAVASAQPDSTAVSFVVSAAPALNDVLSDMLIVLEGFFAIPSWFPTRP